MVSRKTQEAVHQKYSSDSVVNKSISRLAEEIGKDDFCENFCADKHPSIEWRLMRGKSTALQIFKVIVEASAKLENVGKTSTRVKFSQERWSL